jgi:hypothetical protein
MLRKKSKAEKRRLLDISGIIKMSARRQKYAAWLLVRRHIKR